LARALQPLAQLGQKSPKAGIVRGPHQTEAARNAYPDIVVVWFIYFPPNPDIVLHECLLNYDLVEQASKTYGVAVVLSGHTHRNIVYPARNGCEIWNGGSATQFSEPKGNWIQLLKFEVSHRPTSSRSAP
jgi:hypothetical protein